MNNMRKYGLPASHRYDGRTAVGTLIANRPSTGEAPTDAVLFLNAGRVYLDANLARQLRGVLNDALGETAPLAAVTGELITLRGRIDVKQAETRIKAFQAITDRMAAIGPAHGKDIDVDDLLYGTSS